MVRRGKIKLTEIYCAQTCSLNKSNYDPGGVLKHSLHGCAFSLKCSLVFIHLIFENGNLMLSRAGKLLAFPRLFLSIDLHAVALSSFMLTLYRIKCQYKIILNDHLVSDL